MTSVLTRSVIRFSLLLLGAIAPLPIYAVPGGAQSQSTPSDLCQTPALSRLVRHRIAPGETLAAIAQQYNLIPATLMGMNPILREGRVPVGAEIVIPPYNGIRVEVPNGQSWRDLATSYRIRADALYTVNGCQNDPRVVFVPGVNWSPYPTTPGLVANQPAVLTGYPLPTPASLLSVYGWQPDTTTSELVFHSGVDLIADEGTPVLAVGDGTVAFVGEQGNYGNLIVVNHRQGLQTRYAQLASATVRVGQVVRQGDRLGTVGSSGSPLRPHLHFEVRSNSDLGWVAQDPSDYIRAIRVDNP